ncbi:hypothetical protein BLL52_3474 [Rhodoferax antarcticus ANT.BR]|uniref:Uncharacterized protein n=1 Tax=Rhodoferax antarcticus ANT.BR TaxID=1111071 RepID=A0A1Q8YBR7_9BURK|nr:hypothetical protein BLL52_3474 [Rhodoferax antarcticus ANT.BR]
MNRPALGWAWLAKLLPRLWFVVGCCGYAKLITLFVYLLVRFFVCFYARMRHHPPITTAQEVCHAPS